jgi:multicomponent Na+:H+ antiporter subunit E
VKHISGLFFILSIFWVINSGHLQALLLGLGLLSVITVILINMRMEKIDGKYEPPVLLTLRMPAYLFWLLIEIIKSNIDLVKRVWQPRLDISPTVVTVKASQKSDVYRVLYANSITMTPGTVTMDVRGDEFEVHALCRETAESLQQGEMDRRVSSLER